MGWASPAGKPFYSSFGKTYAGSQRWKCMACQKTFSVAASSTSRQRDSHKNKLIFKLLMNKMPLRRICDVAEMGPNALVWQDRLHLAAVHGLRRRPRGAAAPQEDPPAVSGRGPAGLRGELDLPGRPPQHRHLGRLVGRQRDLLLLRPALELRRVADPLRGRGGRGRVRRPRHAPAVSQARPRISAEAGLREREAEAVEADSAATIEARVSHAYARAAARDDVEIYPNCPRGPSGCPSRACRSIPSIRFMATSSI